MINRQPLSPALALELRQALPRHELELHYQPEVDARTRRIVAVEALLRWHHPDRGLVPPAEFIPEAEESGMIIAIGEWVIQRACAEARFWRASGLPAVRVAVNLSAVQFGDRRLVQRVEDALDAAGLEAEALEFEITESAMARDCEDAARMLAELRALGVRLVVDDFGTGYSSLAHLKRFPLDGLKIDRSFVQHLPGDKRDASITRALISMAHDLGLEVVAEGVEAAEQLGFLNLHGCDLAQGYFFGAPMPAGRIREALRAEMARRRSACEPSRRASAC